ncbi:MAG TPA: hypothetical protein DD444_00510 [Citreicella sp.]|jgi:hypothetical protein|nr:hypothetical protein [Citreicella sp.]
MSSGCPLSGLPARAVSGAAPEAPLRFSFLSLVTRPDQYAAMVSSFVTRGFTPDVAEFLYVDNRDGNQFDAYSGLNRLLQEARGSYLICLHQDVLALQDDRHVLEARLAELEAAAPRWAIAANAGRRDGRYVIRISDRWRLNQARGPFPAEVDVVDENFILLRRDRLVAPSCDLTGFHLYGLDLVQQAQARGLTAHVIDFHVEHQGEAVVDQRYFDCLDDYEAKAARQMRTRKVPTLAEDVWLDGTRLRLSHHLLRLRRRINYLRRQARYARRPRANATLSAKES